MAGDAPFEIIYAPAEVYLAPVGEAFPDLADAPAANWVQVGTAGADNQTEDGLVIRRNVSLARFRSAASTVARKMALTEADFQVEFTLADLNPEELLYGLGGDPTNDITDTAAASGTAGNQNFVVPTDPIPQHWAMLVRVDQSPFGAAFKTQFELYDVVQVGSAEGAFNKNSPFSIRHVYEALKTSAGDFVVVRIQDETELA